MMDEDKKLADLLGHYTLHRHTITPLLNRIVDQAAHTPQQVFTPWLRHAVAAVLVLGAGLGYWMGHDAWRTPYPLSHSGHVRASTEKLNMDKLILGPQSLDEVSL